MTQVEPQVTSTNPISQTANNAVFSQAAHDLVLEKIQIPSPKTTLAVAMELVYEGFAKIGIQIGNKPNEALKLMDYRNAQIRDTLNGGESANDATSQQSEEKKAA